MVTHYSVMLASFTPLLLLLTLPLVGTQTLSPTDGPVPPEFNSTVDLAELADEFENENFTDIETGTKNHLLMHGTRKGGYNLAALKGKTLRVVVPMIEPPYVNYMNMSKEAQDEHGYSPGVVLEILRELGKGLDLEYELSFAETQEWGTITRGNWTGAFGELVRGEADILGGAAIMMYDRSLWTDLTYPFQFSETGMMIRSPEKYFDNTLLIVTEPFKWEVWGLTAVSIVLSGIILKAFTTALVSASEIQYTWFEAIWVFFSVFVQQGLPVQPKSWTCRTMLAFWWLASLTLIATFTGSLVALFAVDKTNMPFTNLDDMVRAVQRGSYHVVMDSNSLTRTQMIARSDLKSYQDLWHEMKDNGKYFGVDGLENGVKFIKEKSGYVLLGPMVTLKTLAFIDCDVIVLDQGILPTYMSIPLLKDSPYAGYFSERIRELVEYGFIEKWLNDYTNYQASQQRSRCNGTGEYSTTKGYLDMDRAQGAFWVLLTGVGLSLVGLSSEHVIGFFKRMFHLKDKEAEAFSAARLTRENTQRDRSVFETSTRNTSTLLDT